MKYLFTLLLYFWMHTIAAQSFIDKRTVELGGSMAISYQKGSGDAELSLGYFSFSPYAGYMVLKGFEIGVSPMISSYHTSGASILSELSIYIAPAYHFDLKSNVYPYIELLAGYGMIDHSSFSEDAIGWGGHLGMKAILGPSSLLIINVEYLRQTFKVTDEEYRGHSGGNYNIDALSLGLGFRVYFGKKEKKDKS